MVDYTPLLAVFLALSRSTVIGFRICFFHTIYGNAFVSGNGYGSQKYDGIYGWSFRAPA